MVLTLLLIETALQKEVSAFKIEISRISTDTQFNGTLKFCLDSNFSAAFLISRKHGQTISS